jgi:hypothetical protein
MHKKYTTHKHTSINKNIYTHIYIHTYLTTAISVRIECRPVNLDVWKVGLKVFFWSGGGRNTPSPRGGDIYIKTDIITKLQKKKNVTSKHYFHIHHKQPSINSPIH